MKPRPLQNLFNGGMKRDVARNRMQPNTAWDMVDLIIDYGAPARERAGWVNYSSSISAVSSSAASIRAGIYAIFSQTSGEDPENLCVDEDGHIYKVSDGAASNIGAGHVMAQNPVFHGGAAVSAATAVYTGLVIFPDGTGAAVPKKYDGNTLSNLGGSPPAAKYAAVFKDYTVLGNGTVSSIEYPNRIWFSQPGDPDAGFSSATAWDTTDSWIDFSLPIKALAATKSALLVFHDGQISRVRGSIPPPGEDMVVDDPWQNVGHLDPFAIVVYQDQIFWAAPEGVFRSDGVYLDDLTAKGGMLRYWLDTVSATSETASGYDYAMGVIRNKIVLAIMDGSSFVDGFMIDVNTWGWTRISNLPTTAFWPGLYGSSDETYFGRRDAAFVGRLDTIFQVGNSSYKNDGNGTAVASVMETPYFEIGRPGIKTVKALHAGYTLEDFASDNPTIDVSYVTSPESTAYTSVGTLSENTMYDRRRVPIGGRMYGLAFKFTRSNAGDFFGYDLSAEVGHQEESKRLT